MKSSWNCGFYASQGQSLQWEHWTTGEQVQQGGGNFMLCTCMADMNASFCEEPEG